MSKIETFAAKAATNYSNLSGDKQAALDPATILSFIEIIGKVIDLFKQCKQSPSSAAATVKNPGLFARIRLRNLVKDSMNRSDFRSHGEDIISALHKTGGEMTVDDVHDLYEE